MVIKEKKSIYNHHLTLFLKNALTDNFKRLKHGALLKNGMRIRRHWTWKKNVTTKDELNFISLLQPLPSVEVFYVLP